MMSKKAPLIRDARGHELKAGDTVYLHLQEPLILATITEGPRPVGHATYELLITSRGLTQCDPSEPTTWIVGQGMADIFDQHGQVPGFKSEAEARQAARLMFGIEKSDKGYTVM
jgi:hypothetical protein